MKKIFLYADILAACIIFSAVLFLKLNFYNIVLFLLEFMVIIELVQMVMIFFKRQRIKIRYMVDASIIYIIRELMISLTEYHKDFKLITFYLFLIGAFFFFRFLAIKITYKEEREIKE